MERKYRITIPEPCQEDWNKMTPNDTGRFCGSCSKNVVDFTNMIPEEIQIYFQQNKNVCGRIKKSQLDSITIQIPSRVLYSQTQYHKMFLLALFIATGTTLFSCADKNGEKQKFKTIEVVQDKIEKKSKVGIIQPSKDSLNSRNQRPNSKINQIKFTKPKTTICSEVVLNKEAKINSETSIIYEDNTIYGGMGIDVYPEYVGGMLKFNAFIKNNYLIPEKARKLNGKIQATFVIEKEGTLNDVVIMKDLGFGTGDELIRVLKQSKKWTPAEERGKKIRFQFESEIFITTDTVRKIFNLKKVTARIDTIQIKRITKFKD
ncbi:energy transducer TonB [Flavobacterium nackdongense]|uniref:TonB C-terminal domain-containing protein n=1 Tax=Flavobacterium nackdongense TaxID=2547394 RepID=A0A4P6YBR9_9FLAO|nr:hypothetical protein [Flavobacterium nackdongense]QBN19658.1 hypothetical protein E1750_12880 [Flavobacterium nackdongense]